MTNTLPIVTYNKLRLLPPTPYATGEEYNLGYPEQLDTESDEQITAFTHAMHRAIVERPDYLGMTPTDLGIIERGLRDPRVIAYVTKDDEGVIVAGVCMAQVTESHMSISSLFRLAAVKNHRVGQELLGQCLVDAAQMGAGLVTLEVDTENINAQNIYIGAGFREMDRGAEQGHDYIMMGILGGQDIYDAGINLLQGTDQDQQNA